MDRTDEIRLARLYLNCLEHMTQDDWPRVIDSFGKVCKDKEQAHRGCQYLEILECVMTQKG